MSEEIKLLMALCDALGFEVEKTETKEPYYYHTPAFVGPIDLDTGLHRTTPSFKLRAERAVTDYKLKVKGE